MDDPINLLLAPVLTIIVQLIKPLIPKITDSTGQSVADPSYTKFIPLLTILIGTGIYTNLPKELADGEARNLLVDIITGIIVSASASGLYSLSTKTFSGARSLLLITGLSIGLIGTSGCALTGRNGGPVDPGTVARDVESIKLLTQTGTYMLTREDPEVADDIQLGANIFLKIIADGKLDPSDAEPLIAEFLDSEDLDGEVGLAIATAMSLYNIWYNDNSGSIVINEYAVQYLSAIATGMKLGASLVPPGDDIPDTNPLTP